jgi:hypothetical protein
VKDTHMKRMALFVAQRIALFIASQRRAEKANDATLRTQRVLIRELCAEIIALREERDFRAARVPLGGAGGARTRPAALSRLHPDLALLDHQLGKPTEMEWTYTPGREPDEIPPAGAAQ